MEKTFFDFTATTLQGKEISMESYRGKIILIVNTASKCGFSPQLAGLEELYQKYKDRNFVILGFPCNQFGFQEPGDEKSIAQGCVINYGVTFPMFAKVKMNGSEAHPLFKYLKKELPGCMGGWIKWNFTKFLIDNNGIGIRRYSPLETPKEIESMVEFLLQVNKY